MDIEYLKRFVVIGNFLNFRKASEVLFVSQPALSHSIAALEKEIGAPVFIRNTKNVDFTPAGKILFDAAQHILEAYDNALTDISKVANSDEHVLRIGYVGSALDNSLTPLFRAFRAAEPDIAVNLTRHHGNEIRKTLTDQLINFAVTYEEYIANLNGVHFETIENERFTLMISSTDPLARKDSISKEELAKVPLLVCEKESAPYYYEIVMNIFNSAGIVPNVVQEVRLISDIYRLVDMGTGAAIISYSENKQMYNNFDLTFLPIDIEDQSILEHRRTIAWYGELSCSGRKFINTVKSFYNIDK